MASTNKTPQLGLNQWEPGDEVLRADFNADNLKIDALRGAPCCVCGKFIGDGVYPRTVNLGFRPSFLILFYQSNSSGSAVSLMVGVGGDGLMSGSGALYRTDPTQVPQLIEKGFSIHNNSFGNPAGAPVSYIAFH